VKKLFWREELSFCQSYPQDVEQKFFSFQKHVIQIHKDNYLNQRSNVDEITVYFDMLSNYITDEIENVIEKTSSNEKMQVMVMLMELTDSTKLPPHETVKQKAMPKVQLPMVLPIRC
jgi:hypothetical protein